MEGRERKRQRRDLSGRDPSCPQEREWCTMTKQRLWERVNMGGAVRPNSSFHPSHHTSEIELLAK